MLSHLARALAQRGDPRFARVLWRSVLVTAGLMLALGSAALWGLAALPDFRQAWLDTLVDVLAGLGLALALVVLAFPVAGLVVSLFLEEIADAVEARHYPETPGRDLSPGEAVRAGLALFATTLFVNLAVLPLYLIPGANLVLFVVVNGYLIGREYFELVAFRHMPRRAATALRRRHRGRVFQAGVVIALALAVPGLNLLAPLFGAAFMVHVFKAVERSDHA